MDIEKIPVHIWGDVISGKIECEFEFLALKILLMRLKLAVKNDPSPSSLKKSVDELKNLFIKTQKIPVSKNDLQKIFAKGGI